MPSIRQRKAEKAKNVSYIEEISKPKRGNVFNQFQIFLTCHRVKIFIFLLLTLVIIYLHWPSPTLSKHAQNWHDNSYIFKYQNYNVLYQDIIRLDRPISLYPVLLILHGFPMSSYDWKDLIPDLSQRFRRIVIPDFIGMGFSEKPRNYNYSISDQASLIEQLIASLNITHAHILAHDIGDTVTQELLARNREVVHPPFKIKSICLTNGGIIPSTYQPVLIQKLMVQPYLNTILARILNWYIFKKRFSPTFGPDTQPSLSHLNDIWAIARHNDGNLVMPLIMGYINEREINEKRWLSALQGIEIPLHLIYGPSDPVNTVDTFLPAYKEILPHSGISVLGNTGHFPHSEDKVGFIGFYNDFLDKVGHY